MSSLSTGTAWLLEVAADFTITAIDRSLVETSGLRLDDDLTDKASTPWWTGSYGVSAAPESAEHALTSPCLQEVMAQLGC